MKKYLLVMGIVFIGSASAYADNVGGSPSLSSSSFTSFQTNADATSSLAANNTFGSQPAFVNNSFFNYQTPPLVAKRNSDFDMSSNDNWLTQSSGPTGQTKSLYTRKDDTLDFYKNSALKTSIDKESNSMSRYSSDNNDMYSNADSSSTWRTPSSYSSHSSLDSWNSNAGESGAGE